MYFTPCHRPPRQDLASHLKNDVAAHLQLLNEKVTKLQIQLTTSSPETAQGQGLESTPTTSFHSDVPSAADTQSLLHGLYQRIVSLEQRSYHETIGHEENKVRLLTNRNTIELGTLVLSGTL